MEELLSWALGLEGKEAHRQKAHGHITFVPLLSEQELRARPFVTLQPTLPNGEPGVFCYESLRHFQQELGAQELVLVEVEPTEDFTTKLGNKMIDLLRNNQIKHFP